MANELEFPNPNDANDVVKAFAGNPAFQAAEWEELTTEDNPFRRPVRPDDLAWLDYSKPMPVEKALRLSALLGHRMLRNIYDTDLLFLAPEANPAAERNRTEFYAERNRSLGAMARPVLERHLFTYLDGQRRPWDGGGLESLRREVGEYWDRRTEEPGPAFDAVQRTKGRREACTFLLLQLTAFVPARQSATARAGIGEYAVAHPRLRELLIEDYLRWVRAAGGYRELLADANLVPTEGAYWQLYLSTSLARGNHLHFLANNHERLGEFLGALLHKWIDDQVSRPRLAEVCVDGLNSPGRLFTEWEQLPITDPPGVLAELVGPLADVHGTEIWEAVHRGFADAVWFTDLWHRDLAEQVTWADKIEEYQEKAEKLDQIITNENIEVDLDTFVESEEETSTTHVHDDHRLVMIEVGQMHFWNNVTHKIQLNQGDKLLIPESRLHGSTVLSGSCTYHQPIIPDDMLRQVS